MPERLHNPTPSEARFNPLCRPLFDALRRDPLADLTQALINLRRRDETLRIVEDRPLPPQLLEYLSPCRFKMGRLIHILAEF